MSQKRFDVVLNEFDEIEYITDIVDCEDRDFADFLDYANELANENKELKYHLNRTEKELQEYKEFMNL